MTVPREELLPFHPQLDIGRIVLAVRSRYQRVPASRKAKSHSLYLHSPRDAGPVSYTAQSWVYVPMRALWVLSRALLAGEALSPTIEDADLESASDAEFYAYNSTGSKPGLFVDFVRKAMDMASQ